MAHIAALLLVAVAHPIESALLALSASAVLAVARWASRNNPTW